MILSRHENNNMADIKSLEHPTLKVIFFLEMDFPWCKNGVLLMDDCFFIQYILFHLATQWCFSGYWLAVRGIVRLESRLDKFMLSLSCTVCSPWLWCVSCDGATSQATTWPITPQTTTAESTHDEWTVSYLIILGKTWSIRPMAHSSPVDSSPG